MQEFKQKFYFGNFFLFFFNFYKPFYLYKRDILGKKNFEFFLIFILFMRMRHSHHKPPPYFKQRGYIPLCYLTTGSPDALKGRSNSESSSS